MRTRAVLTHTQAGALERPFASGCFVTVARVTHGNSGRRASTGQAPRASIQEQNGQIGTGEDRIVGTGDSGLPCALYPWATAQFQPSSARLLGRVQLPGKGATVSGVRCDPKTHVVTVLAVSSAAHARFTFVSSVPGPKRGVGHTRGVRPLDATQPTEPHVYQ